MIYLVYCIYFQTTKKILRCLVVGKMCHDILSEKVCPTTYQAHDPNFINKYIFIEKRPEGKDINRLVRT